MCSTGRSTFHGETPGIPTTSAECLCIRSLPPAPAVRVDGAASPVSVSNAADTPRFAVDGDSSSGCQGHANPPQCPGDVGGEAQDPGSVEAPLASRTCCGLSLHETFSSRCSAREYSATHKYLAGDPAKPDLDGHTVLAGIRCGGRRPSADGTVTMGAIGVGHRAKGTDLLLRLVEMTREATQVQFVLIGYVKDRTIRVRRGSRLRILSSNAAMDAAEMRVAIEGIDYALFLLKSTSYVLTESASLADALSSGKPIIALRSEIVEDRFNRFGNIGYLGIDLNEVAKIITRVGREIPKEEYGEQRANVILASHALAPSVCAGRLLWEGQPGS